MVSISHETLIIQDYTLHISTESMTIQRGELMEYVSTNICTPMYAYVHKLYKAVQSLSLVPYADAIIVIIYLP